MFLWFYFGMTCFMGCDLQRINLGELLPYLVLILAATTLLVWGSDIFYKKHLVQNKKTSWKVTIVIVIIAIAILSVHQLLTGFWF
jgi:hypothetical protein